jgi:hypothetical protein
MESEDGCRRRRPPVLRREFMRSRHEMEWAARAYAIVVPVVSKGLGLAALGGAEHRPEGAVALRRLA